MCGVCIMTSLFEVMTSRDGVCRARKASNDDIGVSAKLLSGRAKPPLLHHKTIADFYNRSPSNASTSSIDQGTYTYIT